VPACRRKRRPGLADLLEANAVKRVSNVKDREVVGIASRANSNGRWRRNHKSDGHRLAHGNYRRRPLSNYFAGATPSSASAFIVCGNARGSTAQTSAREYVMVLVSSTCNITILSCTEGLRT
jgi:hypothetical protein